MKARRAPLGGPPEPTERQLRLAWPYFYGRGSCPATLDAALADPFWGLGLRNAARCFGRPPLGSNDGAAAAAASRLGAERYVPPTPAAPSRPPRDDGALGQWAPSKPLHANRRPVRVGAHDAKRAAANDRDEK